MSASFRELRVWQQSMELALSVYRGTAEQRSFPDTSFMDWRSKCVGQPYQYPAILRRGKDTGRTENFSDSFITREDR